MRQPSFWLLPVLAGAVVFIVPEKHWPECFQPDLQLGVKYHLLRTGMTMDEVDAILGHPTERVFSTCEASGETGPQGSWTRSKATYSVCAEWKSKGQYIVIGFKYGVVVSMSQKGIGTAKR